MKFLAGLLVCGAMAVSAVSARAQDNGYWRASSETAKSTTGDIGIGTLKVTINFALYTIAQIHKVDAAQARAVFDIDAPEGAVVGNLYHLSIEPGKKLLHKNTLCGNEETQYMVTAVVGKELHVAFFSGSAMPELKAEAIMNSTTLCGTYTYMR
ncbi:hypothetical protein SAMN05421819_4163 [Bryocella elongata]|uniref:Uncharacterized protein n=1 Tax=Bryocella elongata TaxID=863522 RepID=A0A1H6C1K7_9BACT|nr:hypothetical protein [Bryocella elongata]SEG66828.1 hypothetical protein SAMN05421819_4163 [Bryocella elongata]